MIGNEWAKYTLQHVSQDASDIVYRGTIGEDKLIRSILMSDTEEAASKVDVIMRALFGMSTNAYNNTYVKAQEGINEALAGYESEI